MFYFQMYRKLIFTFALLATGLMVLSCSAAKQPVNAGPDGIAIKGYDTVAYFTEGKPVKGSMEYSYKWNGATWLFANEKHLNLFTATPDKYAPQFGGY